jgi:lysophospholipid acyltransferase (LPLAT)-like uncharacterized protein
LSLKLAWHQAILLTALGKLLAAYLWLVRATSRVTYDPPDLKQRLQAQGPVIVALWHGQHLMIPFAKPATMPFSVMISRHRDGEINAVACRAFGIEPVRASGGRPDQSARKGGAGGMLALLRHLKNNLSVSMTADVPKVARVAGAGIIALGRLSQRPIIPLTVISSRVKVFDSWDKATMGLPFGHLVITMGEPMLIDPDADKVALEEYRDNLQSALDHLHHRAYAMVGAQDPGMDLRKSPVSASASEAS